MSKLQDQPIKSVEFRHHKVRNFVAFRLASTLVGVAFGALAAGLYYVGLETVPSVTAGWHHAIPNRALRHAVRGGGEGFFFRLGAKGQTFNPAKQSFLRKHVMNHIEHGMAGKLFFPEIGQPMTRGQKVAAVVATPLFMAAGGASLYFLGRYAVSGLQVSAAWQHAPGLLKQELVSKDIWIGRAVGYGMHLGMYPTRSLRAERYQRKQTRLAPRADRGELTVKPYLPGGRARLAAIKAAEARRGAAPVAAERGSLAA